MSIYATMWEMYLPVKPFNKCVCIYAQGVPPHIGHPKCGYDTDPYADFLPPVVMDCDDDNAPYRAVVIVQKGRHEKNGQKYITPVVVLSGEEYRKIPFQELIVKISNEIDINIGLCEIKDI